MTFQHYTPQTLAWRTSSYLCRSPDQGKEYIWRLYFLFWKRLCQRTGSKRMMQTNAAVARFQILLAAEDPKRAPTGLGNSTDCRVRGSQRKVKHQNTKKSNTPRLKHKNTQKWNIPQLSSIPWLPSGGPPMSQEQPMIIYINLRLLK